MSRAEEQNRPKEAVLTVKGARKTFGETTALCGASFSLYGGEWLALLGPNGAGKTTLIRSVAGRVLLDEGEINLLDQEMGKNGAGRSGDSARNQLGVVPQEIALYPVLTARENLEIWGRFHGVAKRELDDRVGWALDWTDLTERRDDRVEGYSGGMKRRLNLACGVLHAPRVVLLDEPTVGVDPQSRERIWEMLGQLQKGGASLLLTTHQLDEAQNVCERIVVIDHGKVRAEGTFDQLVRKTLGGTRQVTLRLRGDVSSSVLEELGLVRNTEGAVPRATYVAHLEDLPSRLGPWLGLVEKRGLLITDLEVESPTLQKVFLSLTGRELRE